MTIHIKQTLTLTMLLAASGFSYAQLEQHYTDADFTNDFLTISVTEGGDDYWITYSGDKKANGVFNFYLENSRNNLIEIGKDSSGAVVPTTLDSIFMLNRNYLPSTVQTTVVNYATVNAVGDYGFLLNIASGSLDFTNNGSIQSNADGGSGILLWPDTSGATSITNNGRISGYYGIKNDSPFMYDSNLSIVNSAGAYIQGFGALGTGIELTNNYTTVVNLTIENSGTIYSSSASAINISGMNNLSFKNTETGVIDDYWYTGSVISANRVDFENAGRMINHFTVNSKNGGSFINTGVFGVTTGNDYALELYNQNGDFLLQNSGTLGTVGYTGYAAYINGKNIRFEQKGIVNGKIAFYASNSTLALYTSTKLTEINIGSGNTLEIVISDADNYGSLSASDHLTINDTTILTIDAENAFLELGDVLTIIHTDEATLNASFANVSDGDTFWSGNYEFELNYDGQDITLTVTQVIPEASTYAAIFGALALAFAAYRRRK